MTPATDPVPQPDTRLQAAATRLRALLADLGDCRGPWYVVNRKQRPYPQRIDNIGVPYVVASTTTDPSHPPTIADYIVTMHPGVGKAVVAVLEQAAARIGHYQAAAARLWDTDDDQQLADAEEWLSNRAKGIGPALALADAILATAGGEA